MAFPTLQPTGRDFNPGSYPVRTFKSQSGTESRILYGSKRVDQELSLTYENITDSQAEQFVTHFDEVKGNYLTFTLPSAVRAGWTANAATIDAVLGGAWRYDGPPTIASVKPGLSNVQVKLAGVL
jgi:hypothetical protein